MSSNATDHSPFTIHHSALSRLLAIMAALRNPQGGCPWDLEQDFSTIAPYTIEEAYEVADAIARGDMTELKEELGDLLLQVVFHAQMASEAGLFTFDDVADAISDKMTRRHPHVFGAAEIKTAEAQTANWETIKAAERQDKKQLTGVLANIPLALPALMRAQKISSRVARVGFDWPEVSGVIDKIREELLEVEQALIARDAAATEEEIGDLLFAVTNLARFTNVDAEAALRGANAKFTRRFEYIETQLAAHGKTPAESDLNEMGMLWDEAKKKESA